MEKKMFYKSCESTELEATDIRIKNWRVNVEKLNVNKHLFCVK